MGTAGRAARAFANQSDAAAARLHSLLGGRGSFQIAESRKTGPPLAGPIASRGPPCAPANVKLRLCNPSAMRTVEIEELL